MPRLSRRFDESLPRLRTDPLQHFPPGRDRVARDRTHRTIDAVCLHLTVGIGILHFYLPPVGFQFLGNDHRQRGQHPLTHLGLCHPDNNRIVGRYAEPGIDLDRSRIGLLPGF